MRKLILVAAVGLLSVACGATGIGNGSNPTPSPSSPGQRFDVTATDTDHAITMRSGQTLEVVLHAPTGVNSWTHPVSSDPSPHAPIVDPAASAARGHTLSAVEEGEAGDVHTTETAALMSTPGMAS